jgi:hypothetical protein
MRMRSSVKLGKKAHSVLSAAISRFSKATLSEVTLLGPRIPCNCVVKSETVQGRMVGWVRVDRGRNRAMVVKGPVYCKVDDGQLAEALGTE